MLNLRPARLVDRDQWILDRVSGRRVLHAGATDSPLTQARADGGRLLHQKLHDVSRSLVGVDIDSAAIEMLRRRHGIGNIICGNLERLDDLFPDDQFDVVLAADVIEHMNNPGLFLEGVSKLLAPEGELIVSVPNAFSFKKFVGVALFSQERNHPDHVCYYSPMNLGQLLSRFGFEVHELCAFLTEDYPPRTINRFANSIARCVMSISGNHNIADEWCLSARRVAR